MTAAPQTSTSSDVSRMESKIGTRVLPFKKATVSSACFRLHQLHGESPVTWENRMSGEVSDYKQVARMNRTLIDFRLTEKVAELMAVIDASLMGHVPSFEDAMYHHNLSDALEDYRQAEFIHDASDANLDAYIKKLAIHAHHTEQLMAALVAERETRKAGK
jgi:hypothetical protein